MKQKSLRQLAKELGVSHSYLSQVKNGKRSASDKVVSKMVSNGQRYAFDTPLVMRRAVKFDQLQPLYCDL